MDPGEAHPLWLGDKPLVLASASRTRFALLAAAGIPVEVVPASIDERAIATPQEEKRVAADQIAKSLAHAKALAVSKKALGRVVLAADQTLACAGRSLHKPQDRAAAQEQLAFLSGRTHQLHAAVVIARSGKTLASFIGSAKLTMRTLGPEMIDRYLDAAGDSATTSVGGYQIEGLGLHLFRKVVGEHSAILGLPMLETLGQLRGLGLVAA
jgi:septum formation protein